MGFTANTERHGLRLREFTVDVQTADGSLRPVPGVIWQHPDTPAGAPLICFGHGASGDRYQSPIPWLARRLVGEHGCMALAIDGPVHGRRRIGDGAREAFWPEWEREGTVEDMVEDWIAALDFAQAQPDIGSGPVGYWGLSMGTIYGAPFIATDKRFAVAVLGLMGITGPDHYRPTITEAAKNIDVPVLFLMQLEDELFTREECSALFDAFASTDKRLHASPGLHPDVPLEELHHSIDFLVAGVTDQLPDRASAFSIAE